MEERLQVPYQFYSSIKQNINSLRPNKSYDQLIGERDYL